MPDASRHRDVLTLGQKNGVDYSADVAVKFESDISVNHHKKLITRRMAMIAASVPGPDGKDPDRAWCLFVSTSTVPHGR